MYDLLKFIDSPDVREYNKDTCFTPAEWSVVIALSQKQLVEEKLDALQYLADHYDGREFLEGDAGVKKYDYGYGSLPTRQVVIENIRMWKDILNDRYDNEGVVYGAYFTEKGYCRAERFQDCRFFKTYEGAYEGLAKQRQDCMGEPEYKKAGGYGLISRLKLDSPRGEEDCYLFDNDLRLVDLWEGHSREIVIDGKFYPALNKPKYPVYVPLPFKKGDIVKAESLFSLPFYGVVPCGWEKPPAGRQTQMWMPLEYYDIGSGDFEIRDGGGYGLLRYSFCPDEDLPEDELMLKLVSAVRKGKMDFTKLLQMAGKGWVSF